MSKTIIALSLIFTATAAAADVYREYEPISKAEMARKTLDEEAIETTLAEERTAAKFFHAYRADINELVKPRANKVHDRVTFLVDEKTDTKIEAKNELKSQNSNLINLKNWFKLGRNANGDRVLKPYSMTSADGSIDAAQTGDNYAQVNFEAEMEHKGEGKTNRTGTFTTKLSGNVVEVLPNGHLVVEARKQIRINDETQDVLFSGVVDPNDLNENSEVPGERVMNLRIAFNGKGEVSDSIRQGWLAKVVNKFKPF
ncbi:MAG: flagellar basal body L-ring protein FlgH [Planctomycetota bacterium]|jgi:flagellar basal body L-ring protein FlgH|nr:flagellar basal body L-ring protein FlgH [Planctomycetota bacterium]